MGQSACLSRPRSPKAGMSPPVLDPYTGDPNGVTTGSDDVVPGDDYTLNLPDECLAYIFHSLSSGDRKRCSLVCRQWLRIEGESRHRLSLNAQSQLADVVPKLFSRFDAVTKLALKCDRRSVSIGDDVLILISLKCRNLTRLKLRACHELTDEGIAVFSENCKNLQKFSCASCSFGAKGMNALLQNSAFLEELSVKRLRGVTDGAGAEPIGPGKAAETLKRICLKDLDNRQCFRPLIVGARNLTSLKLFRCSGNWDTLLEAFAFRIGGLVEVHLERLQVSDLGLSALSNFANLETLHLVKTPECTNVGLITVAEKCKLIRKLHVDGWKTNRISDDGLIAIATNCINLQELVLLGLNPTLLSLEKLATNCQNLERLALCGSETVGDAEIACIAAKCTVLTKLCVKSCPVSDHGIKALAGGGIWVHVDAAYAGSACICPEYRHFLDGVEKAHSFSFNAHKWFLTTLDCCCLWVKDPGALVKALSTYPEYLRNKASETKQVVDYKDWQITLSRRFRSLKLWLVLRSYGVANLRKFLRSHIKMAKNFEGLIGMDKRFEVVVPRNFATVCFRVSPMEIRGNHQIVSMEEAANNFNTKLLEAINESGKIYMTHAVVGGVYVMRFAVGASLTENRHVILAWKVVQEHANALLTGS